MEELRIVHLIDAYEKERTELLVPLNDPNRRPYLHPAEKVDMERRVAWCAGAIEALHRVID